MTTAQKWEMERARFARTYLQEGLTSGIAAARTGFANSKEMRAAIKMLEAEEAKAAQKQERESEAQLVDRKTIERDGFALVYWPEKGGNPAHYRLHSERANSWCSFAEDRLGDLARLLMDAAGLTGGETSETIAQLCEEVDKLAEENKDLMFALEGERENARDLQRQMMEAEAFANAMQQQMLRMMEACK